ncbi:MAG TPA: leucyl aminopeptidase family protein [Candidatus Paceibacterota bacterium]|nr:leucyl aminopeptidase family protein [Candidatus Paceibacterota bacterium]
MTIRFEKAVPQGFTPIRLITGSISRYIERSGALELEIGFGPSKGLSQRKTTTFLRKIITTAKQNKIKKAALDWREIRAVADKSISDKKLGEVMAVAFVMANFEFTTYKQKPEEGFSAVDDVVILNAPKATRDGVERGIIIGKEINATRVLANTPGGDMTPKVLANAAKEAVKGARVKVSILDAAQMQKIGMGAVLGIAKGSTEEPQFIVMEYQGTAKSKKPVVLVGKGVTFDTGGLNIKPGDSMYEMHMDMSGGAAVIHAVALAAKLKLKANVVGLVPAVENSPSGTSVRPGDILKSLSGKTIEILNTDAEGRVILADAITYAKRYNPKMIVDVATLTGAALIALGTHASAFMTNKDALIPALQTLGEESGDYVWPFPVWEEYEEMTKGTFGDIPNISTAGNSRYGGVIAGGMFLREFAKDLDCPWVHIDMAPRMTANPGDFLAKGAVGAPVRLLLAIIEEYGN